MDVRALFLIFFYLWKFCLEEGVRGQNEDKKNTGISHFIYKSRGISELEKTKQKQSLVST